MPLTYLTPEEKLRSLIYISNHELSSDLNVQNKQYEILAVFLNNFIKECDYYPYIRIVRHKGYKIYTLDWDIQKLTVVECYRLIKEFNYRNEKYIEINNTLINELSRLHYPSLSQLNFVENFTVYHDDWMIKDPEEFIDIFHSKYYLDNLISEFKYQRLLY